jgi:transposase
MSLSPQVFPELPADTAKVAKAAFKRKQNVYLVIGDQLGDLFAAVDFAPLYDADGKPAISPNLLALVTVFQFMENLPDREAADAVRSRIDWKYALHLALSDTGFDASVLSEFRDRLARHATAQAMFEQVLQRLQALELLKAGGTQRTDATYVLGATQMLNRVQRVAETLRLALEDLGERYPTWLRAIALPHWYQRYSQVLSGFRLAPEPGAAEGVSVGDRPRRLSPAGRAGGRRCPGGQRRAPGRGAPAPDMGAGVRVARRRAAVPAAGEETAGGPAPGHAARPGRALLASWRAGLGRLCHTLHRNL